MKNLDTKYDPKKVEDRLYAEWVNKGYFHAKPNPDKKPFTIVIPPPNVTGQLHMVSLHRLRLRKFSARKKTSQDMTSDVKSSSKEFGNGNISTAATL